MVVVSAIFIGIAWEGVLLLKAPESLHAVDGARLALGLAAISIGVVTPSVIAIWTHKSPSATSNVIVIRGDRLELPRNTGRTRRVAIHDISDIKLGYDQLPGGAAWGVLICRKDGVRTLVGGYGLRATRKDPSGTELHQLARQLRAEVFERQRDMGLEPCSADTDSVARDRSSDFVLERDLDEVYPPNPLSDDLGDRDAPAHDEG